MNALRILLPALLAFADDRFLVPGNPWIHLGSDYQLTADITADSKGDLYFSDAQNDRIMRVDASGKIHLWKQGANGAHGLAMVGNKLYAGQHDLRRLASFDANGNERSEAEDAQTHHFSAAPNGTIYYTQAPQSKIWMLAPNGEKRLLHEGLNWPRGVRASADGKSLVVGEAKTRWIWKFDIQPGGQLANARQFCELHAKGEEAADAGGMDFDSQGNLYVGTAPGVQICDSQGRVTAVLPGPKDIELSGVLFAGPGRQWLYAHSWNKLYRIRLRTQGAKVSPPALN
jgi:sugar lactone lactonase YvrE